MESVFSKNVKKLVVVNGDEICEKCGSTKVLNVALLGAAISSGETGISLEEMGSAITKRVPEKFKQMNITALRLGAQAAEK